MNGKPSAQKRMERRAYARELGIAIRIISAIIIIGDRTAQDVSGL